MSSFAALKDKPNTEKVVLVELDIGELQDFLTVHSAGVWFVNFDAVYPDIDASLLVGVDPQNVALVG